MNRIIREHYPAAKLPDDLREGINPSGRVTVTVIEEGEAPSRDKLVELMEQARQISRTTGGISTDEAVERIRKLRDEWDD